MGDNYIPAIIILGCIALFPLAVCSSALSCEVDGFIAFALFVLTASIISALYFALESVLAELLDKWFCPQKEQIVEVGTKQEATPTLEPNVTSDTERWLNLPRHRKNRGS